jgi:hypothetical protein
LYLTKLPITVVAGRKSKNQRRREYSIDSLGDRTLPLAQQSFTVADTMNIWGEYLGSKLFGVRVKIFVQLNTLSYLMGLQTGLLSSAL